MLLCFYIPYDIDILHVILTKILFVNNYDMGMMVGEVGRNYFYCCFYIYLGNKMFLAFSFFNRCK